MRLKGSILFGGRDSLPERLVFHAAEFAAADAVEAVHAPAVVDFFMVNVDARGFAVSFAGVAAFTFSGVDHRAENRET